MRKLKRTYDHRVKEAIVRTGNIYLFPELSIPKTTAKNWLSRGLPQVVTVEDFDFSHHDLVLKNSELNKKVQQLEAKLKLLNYTSKLAGFGAQYQSYKTKVLSSEVQAIRSLVEDPKFIHFSLTSLWCYARRIGAAIVSQSTWFRIINTNKFSRASRNKYFSKPKTGIRADSPNQIWHIDITILRIDGVKAYIQAIRDNFSRFILAHHVSTKYGGEGTKNLIEKAILKAREYGYLNTPQIISDGGPENFCIGEAEAQIEHLLAQVDIEFSNSMIESFFHQMKNRHLYYKDLKTIKKLEEEVDFYVKEQNEVIPFLALHGRTPEEVYKNPYSQTNLINQKFLIDETRRKRIEYHESLSCKNCLPTSS